MTSASVANAVLASWSVLELPGNFTVGNIQIRCRVNQTCLCEAEDVIGSRPCLLAGEREQEVGDTGNDPCYTEVVPRKIPLYAL